MVISVFPNFEFLTPKNKQIRFLGKKFLKIHIFPNFQKTGIYALALRILNTHTKFQANTFIFVWLMAPKVIATHDVILKICFLGVSLTRYWQIGVIYVLLRSNGSINMHFLLKTNNYKIWPDLTRKTTMSTFLRLTSLWPDMTFLRNILRMLWARLF